MILTSGDKPLDIQNFFAVIYGLPGVGKTSASFTAPKPVLHLNFDKGLHRAVQKVRPASADVTNFADFYASLMSVEFEKMVNESGIKTVVIDTVGTLLDNFIAPHLIKVEPKNANFAGGLTLQGYGALKTMFSAIKTRMQNLGVNVVCVCHAKEVSEGQNTRFDFAVAGGSADVLHSTADLIGFVSMRGDGSRQINFNPTSQTVGKSIGKIEPKVIPNADSVEYDTFLETVFEEVRANVRQGSEKQIAFRERLAEWQSQIDGWQTPDDFNSLAGRLKSIPDAETLLKASVRSAFKTAFEKRGYTTDPATKQVIDPKNEADQ